MAFGSVNVGAPKHDCEAPLKDNQLKENLADTDSFPLVDSADGSRTKRVLWSKICEAIKNHFDTVYTSKSKIGKPNGVASLDPDGKVPAEQLPEMAGKPKRSRITLSAAGWKHEPTAFGICHQSVAVAGILADETRQLIIPMPEIASQAAYAEAGIVCTNQSANSLTFSAKTAPSGSITVYVAVQEVTG